MRGRLVNEGYNFERGLDPKKSMDIGKAKTDREKMESIDWAFDPFFFNNLSPFQFKIEEFIEDYRGFPIVIFSQERVNDKIFRASSSIDVDYTGECTSKNLALRMIKVRINRAIETRGWTRKLKINENSNFERGQDPKRAMGIDRISKLNKEIEWSWDVPKGFQEDIWEIVEYKGYYIKVSKLTWTAGGGTSCYIAVNDIGEPYVDVPINFPTPEQALDKEKNEIDHYVDEN